MVEHAEVSAEAAPREEWRRRAHELTERVHRLAREASDRMDDARLGSAVKGHPYRAMAAGLAAGWILGRLVRR